MFPMYILKIRFVVSNTFLFQGFMFEESMRYKRYTGVDKQMV